MYKYPVLLYLEAKSRYGNTFYLQDLTQYSKLIQHNNIKGVFPTVLIWFIDHDQVIAFPISSIKKMKEDGLKSINIKDYDKYPHVKIPSIKKRIFMDSDYSVLFGKYKEEVDNG